MNSKRVNATFEFFRQGSIDHAVALKPALSAERARHNIKAEVRFTAGPMPGMPGMQMRFILDVQTLWRKGRNQLCRDDILHSHGWTRLRWQLFHFGQK